MVHIRSRRTVMAAAAIVFAAVGLSACGSSAKKSASSTTKSTAPVANTTSTTSSTPSTSSGKVAVALNEFKIVPAVDTAPAGRVVFVVTNDGKVKHQLTVIRTDKSAATVLSKQNPDDDIPGARGEISAIAPGVTKKLVIKNLKPGHYALVCALPGHYQSGMHADFTVK